MASAASASRTKPPQAFVSSYAPRMRSFGNALLAPAIQPNNQVAPIRTTKRGTTAINYAEDGYDDDDFDESDHPRRPTGLRSLRRDEPTAEKQAQPTHIGQELIEPVEVQGIWRDWMGKTRKTISHKAHHVQSTLPLVLIPIRIDLSIDTFRPDPPFPLPTNPHQYGIDETLPAYKQQDIVPALRLKDSFLWNLHEALFTPDQFAKQLVDELDFPHYHKMNLIAQVTTQIRSQLEDYAGVALHPLFHATTHQGDGMQSNGLPSAPANPSQVVTPAATTPGPGESLVAPSEDINSGTQHGVTATAYMLDSDEDVINNPDDTYRCIVNLNVNLLNKLYSDKFEWSLLHPPGLAEQFARQTCADLGLNGEWASAINHAIYEAVLKLKKEACENGGMLLGNGEIENDAAHGVEAGWRYEPETLADDWEPKVETLSKEEIEKREGDRERQLRRLRRDTARVSSTANVVQNTPQNDYFNNLETQDQPMGRGERSKKKKRFRSLSPLGRDTPDSGIAGYGGETGKLGDDERVRWRCSHCRIWGQAVWTVRDGPRGPRSLCHNCGYLYERDKRLPPWSKNFFATDTSFVAPQQQQQQRR